MAISDAVLKTKAAAGNDILQRVVKTVIEVVAAQAALYGTVVPNPPSTQTTIAIAGGSGLVALVLNLALAWATKVKSARLDALAEAIDKIVDQRLAEQAALNASAQVPHA